MRRSSPMCSPVLLAMPAMSVRIASISLPWRSTKVAQHASPCPAMRSTHSGSSSLPR